MLHVDIYGVTRTVDASKLTADCFLIQFEGLSACETCPAKGTSSCGGGETLRAMQDGKRGPVATVIGSSNKSLLDEKNLGYQKG